MTDTPAFPSQWNGCGMTLRQYAAIKLKVPDSGDPELDDMIRKSNRNELAARAMPMIAAEIYSFKERIDTPIPKITAKMAHEFAGAMITEQEKQA